MVSAAACDPDGVAVVEAAILIETGSYRRYDRIVLVVCTEEQQIERAMRRDGCTREEAEARLRRQMPLSEKRKFADYVVDTSGTKESTVEQSRRIYEALRSGRT
jgi:dephospho-CoA kinase